MCAIGRGSTPTAKSTRRNLNRLWRDSDLKLQFPRDSGGASRTKRAAPPPSRATFRPSLREGLVLGLFANRKLFAFVVLRKTGALFLGLSRYMTGTSRGNVFVGFT